MILGSSTDTGNRAEMVVLSRHFYLLIRSNQRYMQYFFNVIFEEYGKLAGFKAPRLEFEDVAEDAAVNAQAAMDLYNKGEGLISVDEGRQMIGLEPSKKSKINGSIEKDVKKSDMDTFFPEAPGKASGSQAGVKDKQKTDEFSEVNPITTK